MLFAIYLSVIVAGKPVEFEGAERFPSMPACNTELFKLSMAAGSAAWAAQCRPVGRGA